jgi:hypothetical protein
MALSHCRGNIDMAPVQEQSRRRSAIERFADGMPGRNTDHDAVRWGTDTTLRNQAQISAYPDSIGGNLDSLNDFVQKHLNGVVGGVHVLPFYPSSADRGFAPLTYEEVDPKYGGWEPVEAMAKWGDLCADFMVNHVSAQSKYFKDFVDKGEKVRSNIRAHLLHLDSSLVHAQLGRTHALANSVSFYCRASQMSTELWHEKVAACKRIGLCTGYPKYVRPL